MPLHRDQVVQAALELLDEVGLDAFTTRALTARLGVQRGALYWHVKSKHELLTAVSELITRPVFAETDDEDGDWAQGFTEFAHRLRAAMLAHRDGARLVAGHIPTGPQGLEHMEEQLTALSKQGLPPDMAARFGDTIASYVTGYVLQEQTAPAEGPFEPDENLPMVTELLASHADSSATFTACVATIVRGMRAEFAELGVLTDN
jgi:TetR/AcrR family tetracycline transcriptional repressor